jgi:hypothetical protein
MYGFVALFVNLHFCFFGEGDGRSPCQVNDYYAILGLLPKVRDAQIGKRFRAGREGEMGEGKERGGQGGKRQRRCPGLPLRPEPPAQPSRMRNHVK